VLREALSDPVLGLYQRLPLRERFFVRARLWTAPLRELERRVGGGRVLEVGCGHGLLTGMLAQGDPARRVLGIDPDPRKIDWARRSVGALSNVELRAAGVEGLDAAHLASFDSIVVADVLYLLPAARWPPLFERCAALLKPGGQLLLKEAEADGSWKHRKAVAQELVMVHLLRRTHSSGGMTLLPRARVESLLRDAGFELRETAPLSGYSTPHVLYDAVSKIAP
jgi:2-polyprenyl-3-methyl-5-hydroxy-6-metoxy-1,4-benzoquinol methylase